MIKIRMRCFNCNGFGYYRQQQANPQYDKKGRYIRGSTKDKLIPCNMCYKSGKVIVSHDIALNRILFKKQREYTVGKFPEGFNPLLNKWDNENTEENPSSPNLGP
jgi:hypothetical protein